MTEATSSYLNLPRRSLAEVISRREPTAQEAYAAMLAADEAFSAALKKQYGKRAGDMRYHTKAQTPEIRALGAAYVKASDIWREAYRRACA